MSPRDLTSAELLSVLLPLAAAALAMVRVEEIWPPSFPEWRDVEGVADPRQIGE